MKYIVMECFPSHVILLDEEGRFVKAENPGYETGQRVEDPVLLEERAPSRMRRRLIGGAAAALAACIVAAFGINYYSDYMSIYSTIYMDINPSVSMDLNHSGTVVGLEGENEDGDILIEGYDYHGKEKTEIADDLVDRAIDMGFLSEGGTVSFSIDSPEEAMFREYGIELRQEVNHHLENIMSVNVEVVKYGTATSDSAETEETSKSQETQSQSQQSGKESQPSQPSQPQTGTGSQTTSQPQTPAQTPVSPPPAGDSGYSDQGNSGYGYSGYDSGNSGYDSGNSGYDD